MSILITAILKAQTGKEAALQELLLGLAKDSQAEAACIQYDLHQSQTEKGLFIFHEEWSDQPGFEAHQQASHHQYFVKAAKDLLETKAIIHQTTKLA